jgi:hypothetical protein
MVMGFMNPCNGAFTPWERWSGIASEITHQVKNEQDNEYQAKPTATARMASIGISAAAEDQNENNNEEN